MQLVISKAYLIESSKYHENNRAGKLSQYFEKFKEKYIFLCTMMTSSLKHSLKSNL